VATHSIEIELPPKLVLHKDVRFTVHSDGVKLGELRISKGTIDWWPANNQSAISLSWERFARILESQT
jgi:hypothetical protein